MGLATVRYVSFLRGAESARLGRILALMEKSALIGGLLSAAVLWLFSDALATHLFRAPNCSHLLRLGALSIVFLALDAFQESVLVGLESMQSFATSTLLGAICSAPAFVIGAVYFGLPGVAVAMVVAAGAQAAISRLFMARELRKIEIAIAPGSFLDEWRVVLDFSVPAYLASVIFATANWSAQALLARAANGYVQVALLGVALQWYNIVFFIPSMAGRVILPSLTNVLNSNDSDAAWNLILLASGFNFFFSLPIVGAVVAGSHLLLKLYGRQFAGNPVTISCGALLALLTISSYPVSQLFAACEQMWHAVAVNVVWAAIFIGGAVYLLKFGALGVLFSLAIAHTIQGIYMFAFARKQLCAPAKFTDLAAEQAGGS